MYQFLWLPWLPIDRQVSVTVQARPGTAATEKGRSRLLVSSELQTDLQSGDRIQDTGETSAVTSATTSAPVSYTHLTLPTIYSV